MVLFEPAEGDKVTPIGYCRQMTKEEHLYTLRVYDNKIAKAEKDIQHFGTQIKRLALLEGLKLMRDELRSKIDSNCK